MAAAVPERVPILRIRGGVPVGDGAPDLPSLRDRGSADAWAAWRGPEPGPVLLRFEGGGDPVGMIQRVAQTGPVWVDADPDSVDDVMDLAFSGAQRVLVRWGALDEDDLDEAALGFEDGMLLSCPDGDALDFAAEHGWAVLAADSASALRRLEGTPCAIYAESGGALRELRAAPDRGDEEE